MAGPSGATARLALPYPTPDDTVDVPRDMLAMATKLDNDLSIGIPVVTALPASAPLGQQVVYTPPRASMGADEIAWPNWHMMQDGGVAGRWWLVGGSPAYTNAQQRHDIVHASLATIYPWLGQLTIPHNGTWRLSWGGCSVRTASSVAAGVRCDIDFGIIQTRGGTTTFLTRQQYTMTGPYYVVHWVADAVFGNMLAGDIIRIGQAQAAGALCTTVGNIFGTGGGPRPMLLPVMIEL